MLSGVRGIDGLDRLDIRLALLLGLALLPIGLIAMVQTYRVISEADRNVSAALMGATLTAATAERENILRIRGASRIAAETMPTLLRDLEDCSAHFRSYVTENDSLTFAGYVTEEGIVACGSSGVGQDVSQAQIYQAYLADRSSDISALRGRITGRSVVVVTEPVMIDGENAGYVALSVPQSALEVRNPTLPMEPLLSLTFTEDGRVLWSPSEVATVEGMLPAGRPLESLSGSGPRTFKARSNDNRQRLYTIAPLVPDEIYAMSIWPPGAVRTGGLTATTAIMFPLLMWLVSIGVAYFAVHRLVVRHIRQLRQRIRAFTANRRILAPPRGADVPSELREVIDVFHRMTEQIVRDEADLENSLHEKDVLLKEVHHRVKNNLQLIASMMNMQLRKAEAPETRFVLRRLQDRVLGLATIHRNLYEATVLSRVDASRLVRELAEQAIRTGRAEERGIDVEIDVDPVLLYPDQAVPLSLLVTEAMTNALKYVGTEGEGAPWVRLSLKEIEGGRVRLEVSNSAGPMLDPDAENVASGLGKQLMGAFAMQLDAGQRIEEGKTEFLVEAIFEPSDFGEEP
ncbi:sensor histidine kinase [Palleronia sediminis]|uniref:histidine kinase n=1 Tax=Palleronia sediminis TaxID=2547833 RepID=A0A4R6A8X9_9RHOB|nr:histidine kinase dimerization/phosphoacceptor domain -containing protein [Palleronia sediminis]TDL79387.1 sensor histidine kinase [Palleronia sediminis]